MTVNAVDENGASDQEVRITVASPGNSPWQPMAQGTQFTIVEVVPGGGGTAKVQATLDRSGAAADDVDGVDWDHGLVTARTQAKFNGGGLFRLVVTVGSATLILKGVKA